MGASEAMMASEAMKASKPMVPAESTGASHRLHCPHARHE